MRTFTIAAGVLIILAFLIATYTTIAGRDGERPEVAGLHPDPAEVTPDENAYLLFIAAAEAFVWPDDAKFVTDFLAGRSDADERLVSLIETNREALGLVARGTKMKRCVGPTVTAPEDFTMPGSDWMSLGRLLAARSRQERLAGRAAPAVDACAALLSFATLLQSEANILITYLIGQALLHPGLEQARDLACDAATPRPELDRLAGVLDRIGNLDVGFTRAIQGDYAFAVAEIDRVKGSEKGAAGLFGPDAVSLILSRRGPGYFFQPNKTKRILADIYREMIGNVPRPYSDMTWTNWDAALGLDGTRWRILFRPNAMGRVLLSVMAPMGDGTLLHLCKIKSTLSAARLTVALRRFHLDNGAFPADLQALVPSYLAAVPSDPFDGQPFRYLPEREIVYAVGLDGVDGGGAAPAKGTRGRTGDLVFDFGIRPGR